MDDPATMDCCDDVFDLAVDAQRPFGVGGEFGRPGGRVVHRIPLREYLVQRYAFDELQGEEMMLAQGEVVMDGRYPSDAGQAFKCLPLALQPLDRVGTVGGKAGIWPGFLEHHPGAGSLVGCLVEPPAV